MSELHVNVSVPFPTTREAEVAYQVLSVDSEPKRSGVIKVLSLEGNLLKGKFTGVEARKVRVALTSFFDSLILVTDTMDKFGTPAPSYDYY